MSEEDRRIAAGGIEDVDGVRLRLVAHDLDAYEGFYNVVANGMLWFLQHALFGLAYEPDVGPGFNTAWNEGYAVVNGAFAAAVVDELEHDPAAAVLFQDYHLYLAPAIVRAECPDAALSHFVHVPWVEPDAWRVLPASYRQAIHEGLCANDVVGFHTEHWRSNFLACCEAFARRTTATAVNPIGIDSAEFDLLRERDDVLEEEARIVERRPELLVVRVDRTDPSKNIVRGFRAFALLLAGHPELHGQVGMLALLDPSRQDVPAYADYLVAVEREVADVNGRFGSADWLPIDLQIADNFPQVIAAYKQFDVLLVNPISDGMNLVAKEAPVVNGRDGVVVLSENAGAYEELGEWALGVNPFDIQQQADALYEALSMAAEERSRRAEGIDRHVREHGIEAWIEGELAELDRHASTIPSR
jgi:trehalose 6-phosphate synthase